MMDSSQIKAAREALDDILDIYGRSTGTVLSNKLKVLDAFIRAAEEAKPVAVPDGFAVLPKKPTSEMLDNVAAFNMVERHEADIIYRAMLAAVPAAPAAQGDAKEAPQPEALKLGWPKEIWLTPGCDPLPPFKECFEVSWCSEPIGSSDVRYVMAGAKDGA